MSIRSGVMWYYSLFGARGTLAMAGHRLFGRPRGITARCPGIGRPIYVRIKTTDELTYRDVLLKREYAFDLHQSPRVIVDAGANIGTASIYFANRYPEAKIIAVEPEASNFAVLVRNVRSYPAIIPVHAALWNRDGEVRVGKPDPTTGAHGNWGFVTDEVGLGPKVRALTMHSLMQEMCILTIDLAKIDIEGAEREVFEDTRWIAGIECLMIELHDRFRPGCSEAVDRAMQGFTRSVRGATTFYIRQMQRVE